MSGGVARYLTRRGLPRGARIGIAALNRAEYIAVYFGAMRAGWDEPRWPTPVLRNANGAPAIVAKVPEEAKPFGTRWELPVVLDAVTMRGPDERKNVYLDLYLRRTGPIARTTAALVHVERHERLPKKPKEETEAKDEKAKKKKEKDEPQDFFNGDHQVVARSFFLSDAPEGAVVDDALGVHLDTPAPGDWDVYVGFGHVSGRRGRAKIVAPGSGEIVEDRIRVGSFRVP